jgi:hypothetical protein
MRKHVRIAWWGVLSILWFTSGLSAAEDAEDKDYIKRDSWRETVVANLGLEPSQSVARALKDFPEDRLRLEIVADWVAQDGLDGDGLTAEAIGRVLNELGPAAEKFRAEFASVTKTRLPASDPRWAELYLRACEARRALRLQPHHNELRQIVFTKHYDLGGSHYAYTEGQSDAQRERHFQPGSSLCILEMDGSYGTVRTLVDDPEGVIRDPDVSYDGRRVLFAWKKSLDDDDYHLYEINLADGKIRQLTSGLGFADYEGAYLPSGEIVFTSSRCVQTVDCWWTEVSNLFTCNADGRHMRQLSFDQVHDNLPTVTHDGRVIYTRWDYNDRGQIYPQSLFRMNQDGTGQTELYGNNSYFPTTILHARSIPGTGKYVCIISGHHTRQKGWLGILEPRKGRQENQGVQLIAPVRDTPTVRVDKLGQQGDQFQYPYPLGETEFLVTFRLEQAPRFGIYLVTIDGQRELLVSAPKISCNQPIPLRPRPVPPVRPNLADYRKRTGAIYLQDIYAGPGLAGVPRGTIKELRVVALDFRAAGIGNNKNRGPAGGALVSTPISIQGAWDVKKVLGTATVHDDGSACFIVPARTPLYFQAIDQKGQMVQSMRSWVSLQPGESVSCVGCHENKNTAPPVSRATKAMIAGPKPLTPFYGPPRGFSFVNEIQPILDRHCVKCHNQDEPPKYAESVPPPAVQTYDPKSARTLVPHKNVQWRYVFEEPHKKWKNPSFDDSQWAYGQGGFGTRPTPGAVVGTQWNTEEIWIRRTFELPEDVKLVAPSLLIHYDEDARVYLNGVLAARARGRVSDYSLLPMDPKATATLKPGSNTLAVHCRQTGGGQFIDVGIVETKPADMAVVAKPVEEPKPAPGVEPAFSLKGIQTLDPKAQRKWSDSYRALADRQICSWINVQSAPPMLPPYTAGSSQSKLIDMLENGDHYGVELSRPELHRFMVWIDLLVPYVGDYTEAMAEDQIPRYNHFLEKRRRWHAEEAENIAQYLRELE